MFCVYIDLTCGRILSQTNGKTVGFYINRCSLEIASLYGGGG